MNRRRKRLMLVATTGAAIGWLTYELIYHFNPLTELRATSSWTLAFAIGVLRQHALHRRFTFADRPAVRHGLLRAYAYYVSVALIGAALNRLLTAHFAVPHRLAWLACLAVTAGCSLMLLEPLVFPVPRSREALR